LAYDEKLQCVTMISGADYSDGSAHYRFVVADTTNRRMLRVSTAGANAYGICQDQPITGEASAVAISGISKVIAGGVITPGAAIASDNQGRAVVATTGQWVLGTAVFGAAAAGIVIPIRYDNAGKF
jgi:hypothetical protein